MFNCLIAYFVFCLFVCCCFFKSILRRLPSSIFREYIFHLCGRGSPPPRAREAWASDRGRIIPDAWCQSVGALGERERGRERERGVEKKRDRQTTFFFFFFVFYSVLGASDNKNIHMNTFLSHSDICQCGFSSIPMSTASYSPSHTLPTNCISHASVSLSAFNLIILLFKAFLLSDVSRNSKGPALTSRGLSRMSVEACTAETPSGFIFFFSAAVHSFAAGLQISLIEVLHHRLLLPSNMRAVGCAFQPFSGASHQKKSDYFPQLILWQSFRHLCEQKKSRR